MAFDVIVGTGQTFQVIAVEQAVPVAGAHLVQVLIDGVQAS